MFIGSGSVKILESIVLINNPVDSKYRYCHHYLDFTRKLGNYFTMLQDTYKFAHRQYDHQFGKKLTAFILFILFNIVFNLTFPSQVLS